MSGYTCYSMSTAEPTIYSTPDGVLKQEVGSTTQPLYEEQYDGSWSTNYDSWIVWELNSSVSLSGIVIEAFPQYVGMYTRFTAAYGSNLVYVSQSWDMQCIVIEESFSSSNITRSDLSNISTTPTILTAHTFGGSDDGVEVNGGIDHDTSGSETRLTFVGDTPVTVYGLAIIAETTPSYFNITTDGVRSSLVNGDTRRVWSDLDTTSDLQFYERP